MVGVQGLPAATPHYQEVKGDGSPRPASGLQGRQGGQWQPLAEWLLVLFNMKSLFQGSSS